MEVPVLSDIVDLSDDGLVDGDGGSLGAAGLPVSVVRAGRTEGLRPPGRVGVVTIYDSFAVDSWSPRARTAAMKAAPRCA